MMSGERAAIYTRKFQAKILDKQPEAEIQRCKAYCLTSNYVTTNEHIYFDQTTNGQPELQRLLEAAKSGLIDVVVITGPGRLSNSPADLITILEQLKAAGVRVATIEPSFLDGHFSKPAVTRHLPPRRRKEPKRSRWTEYAINGPIVTSEQGKQAAIYAGSFRPIPARVQIARLKARCEAHGYSLKGEHIYFEMQPDANGTDRPELERLLEAARSGSIDIIMLNNIQDFSQKQSYLAYVVQALQEAMVRVETVE
jgi:DNA invertase Pin-like site-specific DNA recombinase